MSKRRGSRAPVDLHAVVSDGVLANITDVLCALDRDWNVIYVNERGASLAGKTPAELVGTNLWDAFGSASDNPIRRRLEDAMESGTPVHFETHHERTGLWVSVHAYPSEQGMSVLVRDTTSEKSAQDLLRASEERFRALVEKSWDGLALVDAEGKFLYVSPSVTRILGWEPAELVGRSSGDFLVGDLPDRRRGFDELTREAGASATAELAYRAKDGSVRWLETVRTNLLEEPAVRAVVANFRDVTERRKVSEALRLAIRARDEMLAVVTHDLRNPLNAIALITQILFQSDLAPEDVTKQLVALRRLTYQMSDLIRDLLDVSLIESGGVRIERVPEDLGALGYDAIETLRPLAAERGLGIRAEGFDGLPAVAVDGKRIRQVIGNLVSNAIKFAPKGDVLLRASVVGTELFVSVADQGPGIAPEDRVRIFDRYWRGRNAEAAGAGLGLAIAKGLVEAHGGRIWVESETGHGATFVFALPLAVAVPVSVPESSSAETVH